jgi:hypothetical protein
MNQTRKLSRKTNVWKEEQGLFVDETKARWFGCSVGKRTTKQQGGWLEHTQFTSTNGKFSNCTN